MIKKLLLVLLVFWTTDLLSQEIDQIGIGVVRGEMGAYYGSLYWTNTSDDTVSGSYWTDQPWMVISQKNFSVASGDTLEIGYRIDLDNLEGIQQAEIRLTDNNEIVLHGFLLEGRFKAPVKKALESYRNDFFPFKSKEQVLNLGAGYNDELVSKEFVLYNFGGDSLKLENLTTSLDGAKVSFEPSMVPHNSFTRMTIELDLEKSGALGFSRKVLNILNIEEDTIAALPVQFTIEEAVSFHGNNRAEIAISRINHDFKVVKQGEFRSAQVVITNTGLDKLEIRKIEPNCNCLSFVLGNDVIAPGNSATLDVKFDATDRIGYERKTLAIFSNDPNNPTRVLVFKAHVK